MLINAMQDNNNSKLNDFLIKTTLGVSIISVFAVVPFTLNNIIQERYSLGLFTLLVSAICTLNVLFCYKGKYSLSLNLYGLVPAITVAIAFALIELKMVGSYWPLLGMLYFYFVLPTKSAWLVNILYLFIIIPIAWYVLEPVVAIRFTAVLIGASAYALITMRVISSQHNKLTQQAVTDNLTGLKNRVLLQHSLEQATLQYQRTNTPMSLIMLDLDDFKSINDTYGHAIGDSVLKTLGHVIENTLRESDMAFRVGGEEFSVLLSNTNQFGSLLAAKKLLNEIKKMPVNFDGFVTASIGVVSLNDSIINWKMWLEQADANMYKAKSNGRNQVVS